MMRKLLMAAAAVLAMTGAARGAQVAGWDVSPGEDICSAERNFGGEYNLIFGMMPNGVSGISILNRKWSIPKGEYPIRVWVDNAAQVDFTATAAGPLLTFQYKLNEASYNLFSRGVKLNIIIGEDHYWFGLSGSASMMDALLKCASGMRKAANPFSDQTAPVSNPSNPFKRT